MRIESNDLIDIATAYRESGMQNRVVEPLDDVWISAINESASTLERPKYKERIEQIHETVSKQFTVGLPGLRDPLSGQKYTKCDPTCTDLRCIEGYLAMRSLGYLAPQNMYCVGCLECTLLSG